MGDITELLQQAREGDRNALDRVFEKLYPELRRIAHARLAGHLRSPLMQTTVLVHECYLKLLVAKRVTPHDRAHFVGYAAQTIRSLIVDTVRAAQRQRRGGDANHVTLDTAVADAVAQPQDDVLAIDAALTELGRLDARLASVVEMRFFAGMKEAEIAQALGLTERTVRRDWEKSRLLLAEMMRR